jgi:Mn-dependent DtxR family transcriptional regulator
MARTISEKDVHRTLLTDAMVLKIVTLRASTDSPITTSALAKRFGVHAKTICQILNEHNAGLRKLDARKGERP